MRGQRRDPAGFSPYISGNFKVSLTAVAEAPTLSVSNITDAVEDASKDLNPSITMAAVDI